MMQSRQGAIIFELPVQPQLQTAAVLRDMFELLEQYSPAWYPEELRRRAVCVLGLKEDGTAPVH